MNASLTGMAAGHTFEHEIIEREKRAKRSIVGFALAVVLLMALWLMFVRYL